VIGTPFLNRQKRAGELESTGLYVSTLPLNICAPQDLPFVELCKKINSTNLSLYKHSGYPYHKIQEIYDKYTGTTDTLFDIGFSYQINHLKNSTNSGDSGICSWLCPNEQNQALTVHLSSLNNYKALFYDYLTAHFDEKDIVKMNKIIMSMIHQVLNNNPKDISKIYALTQDDVDNLTLFNDTGNVKRDNLNVIKIFNDIVATHKNDIALICGNTTMTYDELDKKSSFLAQYIKNKKIKPKSPIAIILDKDIETIISILAILKAGCCYIPILPDENIDRIHYIIGDCEPKCIITHKNYSNRILYNCVIIEVDKLDFNQDFTYEETKISPDFPVYIIYTSGSTGNPKGTVITHKNICALKTSIENDFILKATDKDVSMSLLKYSFDASGIDIYTSLLFGGKLVLVQKEDELNPEKVVKLIEEHQVTRSFLIPKWIEHIAMQDNLGTVNLSSLKILGTGGETLKPYILENLLSKYSNLKILNMYGPTETTMFTTCKPVGIYEIKNNYTSIGRPIYGSRLAVVNKNNELMPINMRGELVVYEDSTSIQNISNGYLNMPNQTKSKFIELYNPLTNETVKAYKTGDVCKINENLELDFIGRTDDLVKVNGGYLVALNEVEKKINSILGNSFQSYPIAVPYQNTKIIVLFVSPKENTSIPNIKNLINNGISFYMRPKKIIEIEEFPTNSSGKIDRRKLKEMAIAYLQESKGKIVLPKTKTEKEIYNIIKQFTDIELISINDDFIDDLGLDSLTLTAIYTALDEYEINIQDLYNNPCIKDLALYIDGNKHVEIEPNLDNLQDAVILNNVLQFNLDTILLTGVTGFLGIHLLRDLLLENSVNKIYCIIRNKINQSGKKRLEILIEYFFNSDPTLIELINQKVEIINGDITKNYLGLDKKTYIKLQSEVTTVINSAANVKHFVKPAQIRKDNVTSVDNLIEFCKNEISLAHMSTLSIAGFSNEYTTGKIFTENSFYINQSFNNSPYLISKFEAEKNILIATKNSGLNATIFRLGNIMPRFSDGIFQQNYTQNVFLSSLKSIIDGGVIATELNDLNVEFSPVEECSKFIIELLVNGQQNSIYHILNNKEISIFELKSLLKSLNYDIVDVDLKTFIETLDKNSDEYTKQYILSNNLNLYSQDITLNILNNMNLNWSETNLNYLTKIIKIINKF
jgi:amino acid adenylation domain-containing protein/thioester reductase-like protein